MTKRCSLLLPALALGFLAMTATCTDPEEAPATETCAGSDAEQVEPIKCHLGACHVLINICEAEPGPSCPSPSPSEVDLCNDGFDNDCDGQVDEDDCSCTSGTIKSCYSGSLSTRATGTCQDGIQLCQNGVWMPCQNDVLPEKELCDGLDNDCDGDVDELCPCADGESQPCYGGPPGTADFGPCKPGVQACEGDTWGACKGDLLPQLEQCDGFDNDCDGDVDNLPNGPCGCPIGMTRPCYLAGDAVVPCPDGLLGACACGMLACSDGSQWGACNGAVTPKQEVCDGVKDEDCDGSVDNLGEPGGCECSNGDVLPCYGGPPGTEQVGICSAGTQTCTDGIWSTCEGQITPQQEVCDGLDNDCNGLADDAVPTVSDPCILPEYLVNSSCYQGKKVCQAATMMPACVPKKLPNAEMEIPCNNFDEDCNGLVDDGLFCCIGDGIQNGNETDTDCGGSCGTKCETDHKCSVGLDCKSKVCSGGVCQAPLCNDAVKNGAETDIDCGGPTCPQCSIGQSCLVVADCLSSVCMNKVCQVPTCIDGVKNGTETGVDCGGAVCPPCP